MKLRNDIKETVLDYLSNESIYNNSNCDQCKSPLPENGNWLGFWGMYEYRFCGWQCENNFRRIKSYEYHKEIGIKNHILGDFIKPIFYRD